MTSRGAFIIVVRLLMLLGVIWLIWSAVRQGLVPLEWVAIFVGGVFALSSALSLLLGPIIRRAAPDIDARYAAVLGYSTPRGVQVGLQIVYLIAGAAAAAWGLSALG